MSETRNVQVIVLSWPGVEENAFQIESSLRQIPANVAVIHSLTGVSKFSAPDNWIVLPDGSYYGIKFEESLNLCRQPIMLHIQADATSTDWVATVESCAKAFSESPDLGLWAPLVDYTPWTLARTTLEKKPRVGQNRVSMIDGIVWAIGHEVLTRLRQLDYQSNPLGRGIELAAAAMCHSWNLEVVVDSRLRVEHPRGSGYSETEAAIQLEIFLSQLSAEEQEARRWIEQRHIRAIRAEKRTMRRILSKTARAILDPVYKLRHGTTERPDP